MPLNITRDPDFPPEAANLLQAFNHCAMGHTTVTVLLATTNMLIAAINMHSRAAGSDQEGAIRLARKISAALPDAVAEQLDRSPLATDVQVPHGN